MNLVVADPAFPTAPTVLVTPEPLNRLATGARAQVVAVSGETGLRRRLLEMGLTPQTEVEIIRRAPLGDPIELRLRGYHLSLRADQAKLVMVVAVRS